MAKKKILAGKMGNSKYFFDETGNIVDQTGAVAPRAIAAAILAGIESIPEVEVEDKAPAKPKAPKKVKQAKSKEETEEEESPLSRVTQRVSSARGTARGTMSNIADVIGRGTIAASVGSVPNLRGVAAATLDAAGVGGLATLGGGGGRRRVSSPDSKDDGGGKNSEIESVGILESILNVLKDNNELLQDLIFSLTDAARGRIEQEREREKKLQARITSEEEETPPAAGGVGGILGGLFKGGISKILGPIVGMLTSLAGPLMGLVRFALRINPITAIFAAAVFSLNKTDWEEIFGALSTVFDDLTKGNWLSALTTTIALIPNILIKGIGRLIANVLEWLGFDKESKELNDFITNLDIITPVKEGVLALFNTILSTVKGVLRSYVNSVLKIFADVNKLADQILSGDILGALDTAMQVIVRRFTMIPDMVIQGVGNLIAGIMDYFGFKEEAAAITKFLSTFNLGDFVIEAIHLVIADIKFAFNWLKEKASNILTAVTTWWNSWTITDVIITAFEGLKIKVSGLLAPVIEWWNSWTLVDVISTAFENFKTNVSNLLAPVIEWWNSWSITGAITTAFEDFKQKIINYFGPEFVAKIGEIANFDLAGYISTKIGEVFKTITDFFAAIPGIISNFVTDQIKNLPFGEALLKYLTPAESTSGMAAGRGAEREVLTAITKTGYRDVKYTTNELKNDQRFNKAEPTFNNQEQPTFNNQEQPTFTGAGTASANFGNVMAETVSATDLIPTTNQTAPAFLKRVNDLAVSSSAPAAPIIIDNTTKNTVTNSRPSSISPRVSSGAPKTAPVMSHIERSLYPFIGAYP